MRDLRIINEHFPLPGSSDSPPCGLCVAAARTDDPLCDCPRRTGPPATPPFLPFSATEDNIPKMKEWLLKHFASSTFNQCPHQVLPVMSGPPLEIHLHAQHGSAPLAKKGKNRLDRTWDRSGRITAVLP